MQAEINKLEREVKRQQDIGLTLSNLLNEKIDENAALKSQLSGLYDLIHVKIKEIEALEQENTDLREGIDVAIYS